MSIAHNQFKVFALSFIISAVLLLAIIGCSDDSSSNSAASLPFTNDDGVAELTNVPGLPGSLSTSDITMDASFQVDSDTASIAVYLHPVGDMIITPAAAIDETVTAGATNTITLTVISSVTAGTVYYIELVTCAAATTFCDAGSTSSNDTGYFDSGAGTYGKFDMAQTTTVETGVTIPTITAN